MQSNKIFDIKPTGNIDSYEDFYLNYDNGTWTPNQFIHKIIFQFDRNGRIISKKGIHSLTGKIEDEILYKYDGNLLVEELNKSRWGESLSTYKYDSEGNKVELSVKNSSNSNFRYTYEYDNNSLLIKSIASFDHKQDIYLYENSNENDTIVKVCKINGTNNRTDYFNENNELIKSINVDGEITENFYNEKGLLIKKITKKHIEEFLYDEDDFPCKYFRFQNSIKKTNDFDAEYYENIRDNNNNWIEIKCSNESDYISRHPKIKRMRKINYR